MLRQIFTIFYTSSFLFLQIIIDFIVVYFTTVGDMHSDEDQEEAEVASLLENPENLSSDSEDTQFQENPMDAKDVLDHGKRSQNILHSTTHCMQNSDAEDEFDQYMNSLPDVSLPKPIIPLIIQPTSSSRFRRKHSNLNREALLNKRIKWIESDREMGKDVSYWDMIL